MSDLQIQPGLRERRRFRRYIVSGWAVLNGERQDDLLNVGNGGMLIRSRDVREQGAMLPIRLQVQGYPDEMTAVGMVVGIKDGLVALKFLEPPGRIDLLLQWLQMENCPWADAS